jgi:hypothetical protein
VSKAGNPRLRSTLIQLAWLWLRHQSQSVLALWFEERVRRNGGRLKKTTIVAWRESCAASHGLKAALENGFVFLSPARRKRDIGAAVVNGDREVDLARKRPGRAIGLRPWIPKQPLEYYSCAYESHLLTRKALDRNSPMTTYQISLSISPMRRSIAQFAALR